MGSKLFEIAVGLSVPLVFLMGFVLVFRHCVLRSEPSTLIGIVKLTQMGKWFLFAVAYPFVAIAKIAKFLLTDSGDSVASLCLVVFVAFPLFFILGYLIGASLMNLMLNMTLYKCYREKSVVPDKEACLKIRKMVKSWLWLHKALYALQRVTVVEILEKVCSIE